MSIYATKETAFDGHAPCEVSWIDNDADLTVTEYLALEARHYPETQDAERWGCSGIHAGERPKPSPEDG